MNTVLVTGATGKIGSPLVPRLAARDGIAVRALVRNAENATPLTAAGAQLTLGTLEDARAMEAYGIHSGVFKVLIINREWIPGRITVVFVDEPLGF